jgi:hypothetical protein
MILNHSPETRLLPDAELAPGDACHMAGTSSSGRPIRSRRLRACFRDLLPEPSLPSPTDLEPQPSVSGSFNPTLQLPRIILHVFDSFHTSFNKFGVARDCRHRPSYDPDAFVTIDQLSNVEPGINPMTCQVQFPTFRHSLQLPPGPGKTWASGAS